MKLLKTGIFIITILLATSTYAQNIKKIDEQVYKFEQFIRMVDFFYADTVNSQKLVETAIVSALKELDPHSVYIPKKDREDTDEELKGNFDGIGIQFNIFQDTILVINPVPGGPSEKVGLKAGDRIVEIDGKNFAGIGVKTKDVRKNLKGPKGTKVTVGIARRGESSLIHFTITRDKIPLHSMDAAYIVQDGIGYIKINRFSATTHDEFKKGLKKLKQNGMKHLILDLGGNGGGLLDMAFRLADEFMAANQLIVYTKGRAYPRSNYNSSSMGNHEKGRLVIMIDEGSASASEIVSGAIQDWDRGVILGRRSFGKGLVQKQFDLNDGSALRVTTSKYYTPTGRCIQKPYENGVEDYHKDILKRIQHGELIHKDSIKFVDSLKYKTKVYQKTVYGGGGIMPDVFVPIDTASLSLIFGHMQRKGVINSFVYSYIDNNRKSIKKEYPDFKKFKNQFVVEDKLLKKLRKYYYKELKKDLKDKKKYDELLKKYSEEKPEVEKRTDEVIKKLLKALIARDIWDMSEFYEIYNVVFDDYIKAIKVISDPQLYDTYLGKRSKE